MSDFPWILFSVQYKSYVYGINMNHDLAEFQEYSKFA